MTSDPILRLTNVTKSFGDSVPVEILHGIDLEIREGEMVALIGPSGSGKSTLLNVMGLLDRPTTGVVELDGQDISQLNDAKLTALRGEFLGFVFQFHHLLPGLRVAENVTLPMAAQKNRFDRSMDARAQELLAAVGLEHSAGAWPRELSGGMQQRVALARALMNDPALVLADEPTGNLDTQSSDQVMALLEEVNRTRRTAFLIVTHDEDLARRCARVIRIVDGRIVADGKPESVLGPRALTPAYPPLAAGFWSEFEG